MQPISPEHGHHIPVRQESEPQEVTVEVFPVSEQHKRLLAEAALRHAENREQ